MVINCDYSGTGSSIKYNGFVCDDKRFCTDNPSQDFKDVVDYAVSTHGCCVISSDVDSFVYDSKKYGWYVDEFGVEHIETLDVIDKSSSAAEERKKANIEAISLYYHDSLGVPRDRAHDMASNTYAVCGSIMMPYVDRYLASKNQSE